MADTIADKKTVFISYSHQDTEWLKRLKVQLRPLERDGALDLWDDTKIRPGAKFHEEITKALQSAKAAVLLISADFLASDFITTHELPKILVSANEKGLAIFPIIVSPCLFEHSKLSDFQSVNSPRQTLMELSPAQQERMLNNLAEAVMESFMHPDLGLSMTPVSVNEAKVAAVEKATLEGSDAERFLLENYLTYWEFTHLKKLYEPEPYTYKPRRSFDRELHRLIELGLIKRKEGMGVRMAMRDNRPDNDLHNYFDVTDKGTEYLMILEKSSTRSP